MDLVNDFREMMNFVSKYHVGNFPITGVTKI